MMVWFHVGQTYDRRPLRRLVNIQFQRNDAAPARSGSRAIRWNSSPRMRRSFAFT